MVLVRQTLASADTLSPEATLRKARRRWLPAWCCTRSLWWCHRPGWIHKNLALIHQTLASADTSSPEATLRKAQRRWLPAWCCRLWCCHHPGWIHQNLVLIHQTLASADTLSPEATLRHGSAPLAGICAASSCAAGCSRALLAPLRWLPLLARAARAAALIAAAGCNLRRWLPCRCAWLAAHKLTIYVACNPSGMNSERHTTRDTQTYSN